MAPLLIQYNYNWLPPSPLSLKDGGSSSSDQKPYQFDPNDDFYMAPPACQFLHYRDAAFLVGILEVILLAGAVATALGE